jgi:hypothetical protein
VLVCQKPTYGLPEVESSLNLATSLLDAQTSNLLAGAVVFIPTLPPLYTKSVATPGSPVS